MNKAQKLSLKNKLLAAAFVAVMAAASAQPAQASPYSECKALGNMAAPVMGARQRGDTLDGYMALASYGPLARLHAKLAAKAWSKPVADTTEGKQDAIRSFASEITIGCMSGDLWK